MILFPPEPDVPADRRATAQGPIRYEDAAQDGRILLLAMPHFLGLTLWQNLLVHDPVARAGAHAGVIPILTRLVIEGTDASFSVRKPVSAAGCYQLAHTLSAAGEVDRIFLNMWVSMTAPRARTHGAPDAPQPHPAGEMAAVGRVFAEHVFTRLFAPPEQRKVVRLDLPGVNAPAVPPLRYRWRTHEEVAALPDGAEPLDDDLVPDDAEVVFGLTHTDANRHVNSLVYPRLFEEAAVRRLAARGSNPAVLARAVEISYRKPCFAGDRMRIRLRAYRHDGQLGAVGVFAPASGDARPHCWVHMRFA